MPKCNSAPLTAMQLAQVIQVLQQLGLIMGPTNTSGGSTSANLDGDGDNALASQGAPGGSGHGEACVAAATASHHVPTVKNESTFVTPDKSSNTPTRLVKGTPLGRGQHSLTPSMIPSPRIRRSTAAWYTVTVGYEVGVFQGWDIVAPLILRVSGPIYLHHPSCVAAQAHYDNALQCGDIEIVLCDDSDDE
ncbi:hypothetical protein EDD18DRAFT_1359727 [Armillaria luteobubalina]|uniref:Uncharacterized protein n=1 Tax=Armillaria luteobubalina TaxID=153913 RepID=A0AA39PPZ1_9AGAR|nr:hypothetical protein EDD18DRAFT_1359727 [Armillaria luteobubalina]